MFRAAALFMAAASLTLLAPDALRAQGSCDQCDLPPGCRGKGNQKPKPNGRNCQTLEISIDSDVDFGRVVLLGSGAGRVMLDLTTGEKRLIGDVDDLGGMPVTGRAIITGAPFEEISIDLPSEIGLSDPAGGAARMSEFVTNLPALPRLDANGRLEFAFSGTLVIDADSDASGNLRGRIPISVQYE